MIFGDRQELAIEVDRFEAPWGMLDPQQESLWGALTIWLGGRNLCEHRREGSDRIREALHLPLIPLARWARDVQEALRYEERSPLGGSSSPHEELERWSAGRPPADFTEAAWLDRRDAWWSRHFTGSAMPDAVAPSVGIVRNDDHALVSWRAPTLPRTGHAFVRPIGAEVVSWDAVSSALDEFAAAVAAWGPDVDLPAHDHPHARAFEYYTGLTEDEIPQFGFLPEAVHDPAIDPLAQVVRDLTHRTATGPAHDSIVCAVRTAGLADAGWWQLRRRLVPGSGTSFESDGHDGAQAARLLLGLDGQPIDDVVALVREVGVNVLAGSPPSVDRMIVAATAGGGANAMVLANPRTEKPWGKSFELARALGHLLLDPVRGDAIGAASGPLAVASRRRRSGAFAAEMLLPASALEEVSDGVLDGVVEGNRFAELLERFGVGANTAAFHLWNQGFLSSAEVRDDLIASV